MAISNSVASGISAGSNALTQGLGIGVQKSALETKDKQQKMQNFNQQYSSNMKRAVDTLSTLKTELDSQATFQIEKIKNTIVPEKQSEAIASIEANYQKQLTDLQNHAGDLFKQQFAPLAQMGSQLGYMNPAQIGVDEATFKTAVSGLRPDQQAVVEATKQYAQESAKTQATGGVWDYALQNGETGSVRKNDVAKIDELIKQNATFFTGQVQSKDVSGLTTSSKGKFEQQLAAIDDSLYTLHKMQKDFNPEFLQVGARIKATVKGWINKLNIVDLPENDQKDMTKYYKYATDAATNANAEIHRLTGAQMSAAETGRLLLQIPNFGDGIFTGDNPVQFKSKLDESTKLVEAAKARYNYLLNKQIIQKGDEFSERLADQYPLTNFVKKSKETTTSTSEMVNVISPEGIPGSIPKANLDQALKRGFKQQ